MFENDTPPPPTEEAAVAPASETPPAPPQWTDLGLSQEALDLIEKAGFKNPTPVQAQAIPHALAGKDVIGSAQTGTGKTASFILPMAERFAGRRGTYGLVLCPTREIAQQTLTTIDLFCTPRGVRAICLIGGVDYSKDMEALATYPQIIVATPGRLCDHLDRGNIWLDFIEIAVLDEADRMLDMGFSDQLSRIMSDVPSSRQTLLFSATFTSDVEALARKTMFEPVRVAVGRPMAAATTVEQRFIAVRDDGKNSALRRCLRDELGSVIVFARSKDQATKIYHSLHTAGFYDATVIHSDRLQRDRELSLAGFKNGRYRILIATDVAARGIHVDAVALVINYDLPYQPEDYVHRIGRTGRAEAKGKAITFVTARDRREIMGLEKLLKTSIHVEGAGESGPRREPRESRAPREPRESRRPREEKPRPAERPHREPRGEPRGEHRDTRDRRPAAKPAASGSAKRPAHEPVRHFFARKDTEEHLYGTEPAPRRERSERGGHGSRGGRGGRSGHGGHGGRGGRGRR